MIETWFDQDLKKPVKVRYIDGNLFSQDNQANLLGVKVTDNGSAAVLYGTVSGEVIRADGETVAISSGTLNGNKCSIVLPSAAYAVIGQATITLKLTYNGAITTLLSVITTVSRTSTNVVVDPGTIIPSIADLIEEIEEAVESIPDDYSELDNIVKKQGDKLSNLSPNLFNKNDSQVRRGYYLASGQWNTGDSSIYGTTHPIHIISGRTYKWPSQSTTFGSTNAIRMWKIDPSTMEYLSDVIEGTISDGYVTCTATDSCFVAIDIDIRNIDSFMICESSLYPSDYKGFDEIVPTILGFDNPDIYGANNASIAYFSPNLYNKDDTNNQAGRYISGGEWVTGDNKYGTTHPIYVQKGKTYKWPSQSTTFGATNARRMMKVNESTLAYLGVIEGTISNGFVTCTPTENCYVVIDINTSTKGTFMLCESSLYPDEYIAFGKFYFKNNVALSTQGKTDVLRNKVVVCDGDSICHASSDSPEGYGGWFGRLKINHAMTGKNYGVGGGTITDKTDTTVGGNSRHSVCVNIDTIHTEYESLDYLILEGGTNDADLIGAFSGETPPSGFGTWSETDFSGSYDNDTFCGAVEELFYKAMSYYPHAKIGFIIAMEMGTATATVSNRKRYFDEIVKIAKKWHIPVLNLWENCPADARLEAFYDSTKTTEQNVNRGSFYADGQHPTSYGYDKMQNMIEEWMCCL